MSPSEYKHGAACGEYLEVRGARGKVRVIVVDQCPGCEPGHIDLSSKAFRRIDNYNAGLVKVSYHVVRNPDVPSLTVRVKEGSSASWMALQILNNGNELSSVQLVQSTHLQPLVRTAYGYWLAPQGAGTGPFIVVVRDRLAHRAVVRGIRLEPGKLQHTSVHLYQQK